MDIAGLDKAVVLAALYNRARTQGLGILRFTPDDMTVEEARTILKENPEMYFDYLKGRVMKVDLSEDDVHTALYNRDNGFEAAEKVIEAIRSPKPPTEGNVPPRRSAGDESGAK